LTGFRVSIRSQPAVVIAHLPPDIKRAVRAALRLLADDPSKGEPLQGELEGLIKYRVRRFRIVYRIERDNRRIDVAAVGERRGVYEDLAIALRTAK
jgi:mRNA interferase RelE/StbE